MEELYGLPEVQYLCKIIIGFLVGALIGLERERTRLISRGEAPRGLPGVRSFGLLSLYGTIVAHTAMVVHESGYIMLEAFILLSFATIILVIILMYIYQRVKAYGRTGITTYIVLGLDLGLGILVGINKILEAVASSVLITLILAAKPSIEKFVRGISYRELLSGLELGLFAFVLGPIFMLRPVIIFGIDLSKLYLLFIIVLIISFLSYIGVRIKGMEALKYIALLGGLVNSEAAVANISSILDSQSNVDHRVLSGLLKNNLYIIISAMLVRNIIIAYMLLYTSTAIETLIPIICFTMLAIIPILIIGYIAWFYGRYSDIKGISVKIENPLSIRIAIKIVVIYLAIFALGYALSMIFGVNALYPLACIGGFVSATATILTMIALLNISRLFDPYTITVLILLTNIASIMNKILYVRASTRKSYLRKSCTEAVIICSIPIIAVILLTTIYKYYIT